MRYTLMGYSALDEFTLMLNHVSGPFPIAGDACRELPKRNFEPPQKLLRPFRIRVYACVGHIV